MPSQNLKRPSLDDAADAAKRLSLDAQLKDTAIQQCIESLHKHHAADFPRNPNGARRAKVAATDAQGSYEVARRELQGLDTGAAIALAKNDRVGRREFFFSYVT